jgi:hypothetical protein
VPQRALRMTAVIDEQGQAHVVLTDKGDFILDNRNAILPWLWLEYDQPSHMMRAFQDLDWPTAQDNVRNAEQRVPPPSNGIQASPLHG